MTSFSQALRPLRITTPLGPDVLLLRGFEGHEGLSTPFHFRLDLAADKYATIPFERLVGQCVTVEFVDAYGTTRFFHGMVSQFTQGDRDDVFTSYSAEIVPQFWLLTRKFQSRIFSQQTVPQILATVLGGLNIALEWSRSYPSRDFCIQYQESDFAFACRLMEDEGIFYYFRHSADGHQMVLADAGFKLTDVPGNATLDYDAVRGGTRNRPAVVAWQKTQQVISGQVATWDSCFELPGKNLSAQATVPATVEVGEVSHTLPGSDQSLEVYEFPGDYAKWFDGVDPGGADRSADLSNIFQANTRIATTRMEELAAQSLRIDGRSNYPQLTPGFKFTMTGHYNADGGYLLSRVEHRAKLASDYRAGSDKSQIEYENRFTCLPAALVYRPPRTTPRPRICGPQTAWVVGPAGEKVFCDKYGRIKVQFPWDRTGGANGGSCWIRVGQVWAGNRWGASFIPRVGHEVIVAFEEGDPDRPIVVGNVYNATNMPPFPLPQYKMVAGIKSCTTGGDPSQQFHGLVFSDEPGKEHVTLHSEKYHVANFESDKRTRVQGSETRTVGGLSSIGV